MGQCWTKVQTLNLLQSCRQGAASNLLQSCRRGTKADTMPQLVGGNIHLVTTKEKWEKETSEANKDGKIVVVNFSASWCSPCKQIAPTYRELADKYTSILFLTVDVDKLAEFCSTWDIKATPTFFFLRQGRQLDKLVGANKEELQKKIMAISESNSCSPS